MDTRTEALAQKAMKELCTNRTIICVAHRLDTILDSDQIVVLDEGRIVEQGAPDALVHMGGSYFEELLRNR
jgi:ABC-type multidrug transport system fused ATPase/permease subunit